MLRVFLVIDDYNELLYLQVVLKKVGLDVEGLQSARKYEDVSLGFNPQVLIVTAQGQRVDGLELSRSLPRKRGLPKVIALQSSRNSFSNEDYEEAGVDMVLDSPVNIRKLLKGIAGLGGLDEKIILEKYEKMQSSQNTSDDEPIHIISYDEAGREVSAIPAEEISESVIESYEKKAKSKFKIDNTEAKYRDLETKARPELETETVTENVTKAEDEAKTGAEARRGQPSFKLNNKKSEPLVTAEESENRHKRYDEFLKNKPALEPSHFSRDRILEFNKIIRSRGSVADIEAVEADRKEFVKTLFSKKINY